MNARNKILVLFAHPALHKSRVNRQLISAIKDIEDLTFHNLYEEYPDFHIDVKREQDLLLELMMKELHQLWHEDKRKYINEVRRFSQQLENILISEKDHALHESDHAW